MRALVRAACVRGFLGSPDLIVVQDQVLDQSSELAVPMAQAISAACDRGATVLWITASLATQAAQFVQREPGVPAGRSRADAGAEVTMKRSIFGVSSVRRGRRRGGAGLRRRVRRGPDQCRPDEGLVPALLHAAHPAARRRRLGLAPGRRSRCWARAPARCAASSSIPTSACTPSPASRTRCGRSSGAIRSCRSAASSAWRVRPLSTSSAAPGRSSTGPTP